MLVSGEAMDTAIRDHAYLLPTLFHIRYKGMVNAVQKDVLVIPVVIKQADVHRHAGIDGRKVLPPVAFQFLLVGKPSDPLAGQQLHRGQNLFAGNDYRYKDFAGGFPGNFP